jgi:hypothetical protein
MPYATIANSTYLDFTGWRVTDAASVEAAYGITSATAPTFGINVALILERNQDPTGLLQLQNWGTRQTTLEQLDNAGTLWTTYGADSTLYGSVVSALQSGPYNLTVLDSSNSNYVSSAESRTIWVSLDSAADFAALFQNNTLLQSNLPENNFLYWAGSLSLPEEWNVACLWFDADNLADPADLAPGTSVTLPQGPQGVGNSSTNYQAPPPQGIASLYNFPLLGAAAPTGTVGLIEPAIGTALPGDPSGSTFDTLLDQWLTSVGVNGTGDVLVQGADGQSYGYDAGAERSLDVGVVAAINPASDIALYSGSGIFPSPASNSQASVFTAIQSAIWDMAYDPAVISSSWVDPNMMSPGSPFLVAYRELFVDAALRNKTFFFAAGDGGSGSELGNGLTNVFNSSASPFVVLVGGTSLSTYSVALADPTISESIVAQAMAGNLATLWSLVNGGLTSLPANTAAMQYFVEAAWNMYSVNGTAVSDYQANMTGAGGVDPSQLVPAYQGEYGIMPVTADPLAQTGRGSPDVSALSDGNMAYTVPLPDMQPSWSIGGTSAAAPLWAALGIQLNAIFADQGLPQLGYMNDLLYIAAAIAPGSFNDVQWGNNISSFSYGGPYTTEGTPITPTGYGYYAGPGYDFTSGLGSPNGVLLGRALTAIGHSQIWFDASPDMLEGSAFTWTSGASQALLFQTMSGADATVALGLGAQSFSFSSDASGTFAWTNQFAQKVMQPDFDPGLVRLFDKYGQGTLMQSAIASGDGVSVAINGSAAAAIQGMLSSEFGFADFFTDSGAVRVARPIAVAETAGGQDDQTAIVRLRQTGQDDLSLSLYRVDDLSGMIGGLAPGSAGYAAAAEGRLYQTNTGATSISGPGYGAFGQALLLDVDAGDLIAMRLTNSGDTYWAFAQANETVNGQPVGHLWNYGLNTWGWEDLYGGGDRDFNDLIVQIDFTSAAGSGWLI